eukprot:3363448-Amphidinium_carterae.1
MKTWKNFEGVVGKEISARLVQLRICPAILVPFVIHNFLRRSTSEGQLELHCQKLSMISCSIISVCMARVSLDAIIKQDSKLVDIWL